jgi:exopolysaccharide production protein ExoQ
MANKIYKALVVLLFLSMMGVILGMVSPNLSNTDLDVVGSAPHYPVVIVEAFVYSFLLVRFLLNPQHYLRAIARMKTLVPLLAICIISAVWANNPSLSLRHSSALVFTCLVSIMVGADFELPEILRMFAIASTIHIALVGVYFVAARHFLYSPSDPLSLKGLTTHKNVFGFDMALAVLAYALVPFRRLSFLRWPLTALAFGMLLLSRSSGSMVSTVAAFAVIPFLFAVRFRGVQRIPLLLISGIGAACLAAFVAANAGMVPELFSKNSTLTGRTDLWALIRVAISQRPLFGYGFDSFWQGLRGDSLNIILGVGWLVPTAHNGYYDLMLGTGYFGVLCFLPVFFQAIGRDLRYLATEKTSARLFPIAFLAFWLVYNLNESALLTRSGIPFLLFLSMSVALAMRSSKRAASVQPTAIGYQDDFGYVGNNLPA